MFIANSTVSNFTVELAFREPWLCMWLLAAGMFLALKVSTFLSWRRLRHGEVSLARQWGFLLAWPGMDAERFLDPAKNPSPPLRREIVAAIVKTALGAALMWQGARWFWPGWPLVAAWVGGAGLLLAIHCGVFHLLSLGWRAAGVDAPPIMNRPLAATSPAEFWGARWNMAFRDWAHRFVFRPVLRRRGPATATLAAFAASGLIHDLVISLPAGAGFGRPTAYFLLQAAAVLALRSQFALRWRLDRGYRGWLVTLLVVAGPATLLFHEPFMIRVLIPFFQAIAALPGTAT